MPVQSSIVVGVEMMKSMIECKIAGMECFASVWFGKKMIIGYYSGTLMYNNLYGPKKSDVCEHEVAPDVLCIYQQPCKGQ